MAMPHANARERSLRVRMSDEERTMLQKLADRDGLTSSDVVRQLIRGAYREAFGDEPATS